MGASTYVLNVSSFDPKTWPRTRVIRIYNRLSIVTASDFTTRNSSGDEIANVNFLYDDIVHAVKIQ